MLPTHRPPAHPGEMLLKEFLEPLGVSQVEAARRMNVPVPAAQRHRQGAPRRQRRDGAPVRGVDALGRTDLVDAPGEMGPVACPEGAGEATEGSGASEDGLSQPFSSEIP